MLPRIWSCALERMDALSLNDVEIAVRNDDGTLRKLVMESGLSPSADADLVTTLMRAGDIPVIAALADGFTLHDRLDDSHRVHHMAASRSQNGCPRHTFTAPDLDLWVEDAEWESRRLRALLVRSHHRRGARRTDANRGEIRAAGIGAPLTSPWASTVSSRSMPPEPKVSYESDHPAAEHLYLASGSRSQASSKERGPSKAITTAPQPRAIGCTSPAPLSTFRTPPMPVSETLICEGSPSAS